jgi:hypothetical protein
MVVEKSDIYRGLQEKINEKKIDKFGKSIRNEINAALVDIYSSHDSEEDTNKP